VCGAGVVHVPNVPVGGAAEEEPYFVGRGEGGREGKGGKGGREGGRGREEQEGKTRREMLGFECLYLPALGECRWVECPGGKGVF
jgi:hypothetical protein